MDDILAKVYLSQLSWLHAECK